MKRSIRLEARHQPSGLTTTFSGLSFAEYVNATRNRLFQVHKHADYPEKIVEGNAPFELKPQTGFTAGKNKPFRRGVLLTHGLTDSPYFMRHLARLFQDNGFRVMAILLPGHGTQPGDLLDIRWQEWVATLAYGVEQLNSEVDEIYLAGYSLGGALSVYHSLSDSRVRGLFLFSPAFRISPKAALANWHKLYSWLIPSAKWLTICPDTDLYKYESVPKQAVAQTWALTRELNAKSQHRRCDLPVFIAASAEDTTVDTAATLQFMRHASHPASHLLLYSAGANATPTDKVERVNSYLPDARILSYSHTAIVIPATDAHYGASGEYRNCLHYYPHEMEKYAACLRHPEQPFLGELTPENLAHGLLCRLMYNPRFAALTAAMQRFIDKL
jgi:esterase/lipase